MRLLLDSAHSGSWNMALDDAMLDAVADGLVPATIRIYSWDETTITVGRHQNVESGINVAACDEAGIPIVRRPTGGRAILHGSDITVSIAVAIEELPAECRSVVASYLYLSQGFVMALRAANVDAEMGDCERRQGRGGDCFATRSQADVVSVEGVKVIGSAQRRRGGYLLQQSSIRYRRPEISPSKLFLGPVEAGDYPLENVPKRTIVNAVVDGFAALSQTPFERAIGPSGWEEERCGYIIREYAPLN